MLEERLNGPRSERVYPVDEWQIVERRLEPERLAALESVFAVGNGYSASTPSASAGASASTG